jgi:hypothetical protein
MAKVNEEARLCQRCGYKWFARRVDVPKKQRWAADISQLGVADAASRMTRKTAARAEALTAYGRWVRCPNCNSEMVKTVSSRGFQPTGAIVQQAAPPPSSPPPPFHPPQPQHGTPLPPRTGGLFRRFPVGSRVQMTRWGVHRGASGVVTKAGLFFLTVRFDSGSTVRYVDPRSVVLIAPGN